MIISKEPNIEDYGITVSGTLRHSLTLELRMKMMHSYVFPVILYDIQT